VCAVSQKPPSCVGGGAGAGYTCGVNNDDCCSSLLVPAGSFNRSNNATYPGSVADFRLDRYAVTVGRFRAFLADGRGTKQNLPVDWTGAHPAIANSGWNPTWNGSLVADTATLMFNLRDGAACWNGPQYGTWTNAPAQSDNNPVSCVTWFEAMAFCAWDNAWLVTEVEFNYAQAGGDEQRGWPWGTSAIDLTYANFYGFSGSPNYPVSVGAKSPKGDGRWGHTDLVGNVSQWMMDVWSNPYAFTSCADCAYLGTATTERVIRAGNWNSGALDTSYRGSFGQTLRDSRVGFRCARLP
jgi:formylglycine-generating enzyme